MSFIKLNKVNNIWNKLLKLIYTEKNIELFMNTLVNWYNIQKSVLKNKQLFKLWKKYYKNNKNNLSYLGLTKYCEDKLGDTNKDTVWKDIHKLRQTIFDTVKVLIINTLPDVNENSIKANGSVDRGSDIDITITDKSVLVTMIFAYCFGVVSNMLFKDGNNMEEFYDINNVILSYLTILEPTLDIATYSSNGVIETKNKLNTLECPTSKRFLLEIKSNMYQVLHKRSCREQEELFQMMSYMLIDKISRELKHTDLNPPENFIQNNGNLLNKLYKIHGTKLEEMSNIIYNMDTDILGKFKIQIYASYKANINTQLMLNERCANDNEEFCKHAANWEKYQIIANLASPESAWAVQTFVVVVLDTQLKMGNTLLMQADGLWIVFLENLSNMIHQYAHGDIRKSYKYAQRLEYAFNEIVGEDINNNLSKEEYTLLRNNKADTEDIKHKLKEIIIKMLSYSYTVSPANIRFILKE